VISGSSLRSEISTALLRMHESGALELIKERWWKQLRGGGKCQAGHHRQSQEGPARMSMTNVSGMCILLAVGFDVAAIVTCLEVLALVARKKMKGRSGTMSGENKS
jgi:ionotropic glutamate receptor